MSVRNYLGLRDVEEFSQSLCGYFDFVWKDAMVTEINQALSIGHKLCGEFKETYLSYVRW